ncbi:MAG: transcription-repair coupling factor [Planctomycetaceae bacterium]
MALTASRTVRDLTSLVTLLHRADGFAAVVDALKRGDSAAIDGAWGSSCALSAAALSKDATQPLLVVLPRVSDVDAFAADLAGFLGQDPVILPAWESLPQELSAADAVFGGRLRVLGALASETLPRVIVTNLTALLQTVPPREERRRGTRTLAVGDEVEPESLLRWLVECGFERVPAVEVPGEFSRHGGIVDMFAPDATDPLRFEFFGDEIESIRRFDVESQQKLEELNSVTLTVVAPPGQKANTEDDGQPAADYSGESFLESLPSGSWVMLVELPEMIEEAKHYLARLDNPRGMFSIEATLSRCSDFPTVQVAAIGADGGGPACRLQIESIERFTGQRAAIIEELAAVVGRDEHVLIACHNEGEQQRLQELLAESAATIGSGVELCLGTVSRGFRMVRDRLVVVSDHELFGRTDLQRTTRRRRVESRAIDSFLDLKPGDLVVHLTHGIARFRGMELLTDDEHSEEHLLLEFRDGVKMYVPASLIHLVQKYVGAAKTAPHLSKLGSGAWSKRKQRVAEALVDMAGDMIRLQAARAAKPGITYPPDSHFQQEFEASFPYTETVDQVDAIADVKDDMQKPQPMDRLICGDVGYGKTEVAMRAAFKAVDAGKQVAVLVPTTVLAEQHYRTFRERMAEYPVDIEALSRFKSKAQQRQILTRMENGSVDIVIGTHRLVQKDVRLKDLGLLIIDEEQRFGVEAKELLKQLRLEVDVVTMSATPIPRTLHMSLLGIRDISNLMTPPHDRQAIATRICRFDKELIRSAIVRELNRGGQVYFVHNRVYNIQSIADTVQAIVPEARVGIGHGQMREHQLEQAMFDFVAGRTDVLVCTTIIESGLDIPNANTIFIHMADKYGLADLHQLRGRVGRYKHRAYCYLMLEQGRSVTASGAKRLKAIEEFSELGAGFKIAMRDLEIRGAGNILGTEQSGHISSVGYELYCQLLDNAVRGLTHEPLRENVHVAIDLPVAAYLPDSYIPAGRAKIEMYRKVSQANSPEALLRLQAEMRDRYGPIPSEAAQLVAMRELQLAAWRWKIDDIHLEDRFVVLGYRDVEKIGALRRVHGNRLRIVDRRNAYLLLDGAASAHDRLLDELKSLLQVT